MVRRRGHPSPASILTNSAVLFSKSMPAAVISVHSTCCFVVYDAITSCNTRSSCSEFNILFFFFLRNSNVLCALLVFFFHPVTSFQDRLCLCARTSICTDQAVPRNLTVPTSILPPLTTSRRTHTHISGRTKGVVCL